ASPARRRRHRRDRPSGARRSARRARRARRTAHRAAARPRAASSTSSKVTRGWTARGSSVNLAPSRLVVCSMDLLLAGNGFTIAGLPLHPLLVHAVVILVPLTALALVLGSLWPAARRRLGIVTPLAAALLVVLVPIT